ncbi:MAG: hypothetical protein ACRDDA_09855 [Aeromonas sp.]
MTRIERFGRLTRDSRELKNMNSGEISRRVNQSGARSSTDVISELKQNFATKMEDKIIIACADTRSCMILLVIIIETGTKKILLGRK